MGEKERKGKRREGFYGGKRKERETWGGILRGIKERKEKRGEGRSKKDLNEVDRGNDIWAIGEMTACRSGYGIAQVYGIKRGKRKDGGIQDGCWSDETRSIRDGTRG